jgi:hypothetical protein
MIVPYKMKTINSTILGRLPERVAFCKTLTGNSIQDEINKDWLSFATSPNSSDVQEKILVEACGGLHKGSKKLGADGGIGDSDLEAKPSKSVKKASSVNITDYTPERLLKDIRNTEKLVVIGRCPGGLEWNWVALCYMSQFTESLYKGLCKKFKVVPEPWPSTVDEQVVKVEALVKLRDSGNYLRSAPLKFNDIKEVVAFWSNPNLPPSKSKSAEDLIIKRFSQTQTSPPPMA